MYLSDYVCDGNSSMWTIQLRQDDVKNVHDALPNNRSIMDGAGLNAFAVICQIGQTKARVQQTVAWTRMRREFTFQINIINSVSMFRFVPVLRSILNFVDNRCCKSKVQSYYFISILHYGSQLCRRYRSSCSPQVSEFLSKPCNRYNFFRQLKRSDKGKESRTS